MENPASVKNCDSEQKTVNTPLTSDEPNETLASLFTPLRANDPIEQFVRRT